MSEDSDPNRIVALAYAVTLPKEKRVKSAIFITQEDGDIFYSLHEDPIELMLNEGYRLRAYKERPQHMTLDNRALTLQAEGSEIHLPKNKPISKRTLVYEDPYGDEIIALAKYREEKIAYVTKKQICFMHEPVPFRTINDILCQATFNKFLKKWNIPINPRQNVEFSAMVGVTQIIIDNLMTCSQDDYERGFVQPDPRWYDIDFFDDAREDD